MSQPIWSEPHDDHGAFQVVSNFCMCRVRLWYHGPPSVIPIATARLCGQHKFSDLDGGLKILLDAWSRKTDVEKESKRGTPPAFILSEVMRTPEKMND